MPRLPRINVKEAIYLITCRGEHEESIFKEKEDYKMFLDLMRKYQEQYGIKIFAFCLMTDHLHLLVEMEKNAKVEEKEESGSFQNISDFMQGLNNNYTKYFNGRYDSKGHLFRERFKSALIEKDTSLLKMTAYLHLNPQRLNIRQDAKDYPYSSYQMYLGDNSPQEENLGFMRQAVNEALSLLENKSYAEYVNELSLEEGQAIHKKLQRGGILGSDDFIKRVKEAVEAYQAQGQGQKYEMSGSKGYKLIFIFGGLFLILMAGAGIVYFTFIQRKAIKQEPAIKTLEAAQKPVESMGRLILKEWKVKLLPAKGGQESFDIVSFNNGAFVSEKTNSLGFSKSHYTQTIDDEGIITWQAMQTAPEGEAVWRGQVLNGKMRGILILRKTGKESQDFSFVSTE